MELLLAWGVYLTLGVTGLALGWAWLAPRLPRGVRLAVLGLLTGLAVLALAATAQLPHDYQPWDLTEYTRGFGALFTQLLVAIAGGAAALAAVGRRRTYNARLVGAGVYLVGVGLVLYMILDGQPTIQAPTLLLVGATVALAAAGRLAGTPRWLARGVGLATGLVVVLAAEALRGTGNPGAGPAAAPPDVLLLVGTGSVVLALGGARFLPAQGRVLAGPLGRAAAGLAGTGLVLFLRGSGEWAPGPGAGSTTLYGLPLTLLVVAVSLLMLDQPTRGRAGNTVQAARRPARPVATMRAPAGVLAVLVILAALWHPAPEPCTTVPYADSSALSPGAATWAMSPDPAAPRGAPTVPAFDRLCTHRAQNAGQLVYVLSASCKWAQVDPNYPLVQASGTLRQIELSSEDSPWLHTSHDLNLDMAVDPASAWLVLGGGTPGALLHVEAESAPFPETYRPVAGDRVTIAGRWVYDCGHDPKTELHPAAVIAGEHDAWRADAAGGPQQVHVLQVWMNSAPGVVHVPLAPFDLRVDFPAPPPGPGATPLVQIAAGRAEAVRWTVDPGPGSGSGPQAAVHITPPAADGSAYFELLLGYRQPTPAPRPPVAYTFAFDRLTVRDDLRHAARDTTGIPDLGYPQLGFAGSGHWNMQAMVGHAWRSLLVAAPVVRGQVFSLATVSPVPVALAGDAHLHLAITGYAENDPSDGVALASGRVGGPALLDWDAGDPAGLCCGKVQTFTPAHGAWTLSYHVSRATP